MEVGRSDEEPNDGNRADGGPSTVLIPGDPPLVGAASVDPGGVGMSDVVGYNLWAWQDFARHRPVKPPKSEKGFHCAFRDEEGRRCGRPMNVGKMGLRHNPPLGVHHPKRELDKAISEAIAKARE